MSINYLDIDEAVILKANDISTYDESSVDLILTNKNLIQINKGFFGGDKEVYKFPLSELRVFDGKANILVRKSLGGEKMMECYFISSEQYYIFEKTSELNKWVNAIIKAHKDLMKSLEKQRKAMEPSLVGSFMDSLEKVIPTKKIQPIKIQKKAIKCNRCGAELTGKKGDKVICSYCDNIVVIK